MDAVRALQEQEHRDALIHFHLQDREVGGNLPAAERRQHEPRAVDSRGSVAAGAPAGDMTRAGNFDANTSPQKPGFLSRCVNLRNVYCFWHSEVLSLYASPIDSFCVQFVSKAEERRGRRRRDTRRRWHKQSHGFRSTTRQFAVATRLITVGRARCLAGREPLIETASCRIASPATCVAPKRALCPERSANVNAAACVDDESACASASPAPAIPAAPAAVALSRLPPPLPSAWLGWVRFSCRRRPPPPPGLPPPPSPGLSWVQVRLLPPSAAAWDAAAAVHQLK